MINDFRTLLDSILAWVLLPTTIFGAVGAAARAMREGRSWKQVVAEGVGGIFVANMLGPVIAEYAPERWSYTLFFMVGWGGLELVGWLYEVLAHALEAYIRKKTSGEND